ncbi:MAG: hypothetical protein HZA10_10835, partial [Nitrospirae bacterium]|nr:hypothetical protein [Nitrospirota bacterium]
MDHKEKLQTVAGRLKSPFLQNLPYLAVLLLASLVIYKDYWLLNKIFTGSDFVQAYVPLANFQSDCLRELSWPLWNPYMNFGFPWVGHYLNSSLFPTHMILGFLTKWTMETYQIELLFWIVLGGFGMYLCVIEQGFSKRSALISAVSFMFCGQMTALLQWGGMVYNAACFPFFLLGYFKAKNSGSPLSIITVLFLVMAIFGGYVPSVVLSIYLFAGYVILNSLSRKEIVFGIKFLAVNLILAALITLPRLLPLYNATGSTPRLHVVASDPRFGIISLYNFMTFLLPVKYYFSLYLGELAVIVLIYSISRRKFRFNSLFVMFLVSAWILLVDKSGSPSVLRQIANAVLPFMKLIRLDFIYWFYPLIFAILYLSRYLDDFFSEENIKIKLLTVFVFIALLSLLFFKEYNAAIYYRAYLVHLSLSVLWLCTTFLNRKRTVQTLIVVVLLATELSLVIHRVDINEPPVRSGASVEMTLTDQNYVSQSFQDAELVADRMRISFTQDHLRPSISDSRNRPYLVSVTPGSPYPNYIEAMNQKLFVGWWYNQQESFNFGRLKESNEFRMLEDQPLFLYFNR